MRIGTVDIHTCNDCSAYQWIGANSKKGPHGMRCGFGAFDSWFGTSHDIPDNCPIKASTIEKTTMVFICDVCGDKYSTNNINELEAPFKTCPECDILLFIEE